MKGCHLNKQSTQTEQQLERNSSLSRSTQSRDVGECEIKARSPESRLSHSCIRQIPKMALVRPGGHETTRGLAGFESPWLRKSWFYNPNPCPRAPEGFVPPVLHLHPFTGRKMEISSPILAKSKVCKTPPTMEETPPKLTEQQRDRERERKECLKI